MGGRDSVGSGPGLGWRGLGSGGAGERASVGAMRRRGQHEGSRKRPIGGSPRPQWAAWRMAGHGGRNAGGEARRVQDGGDERGRDGRERRPRRAQARWQGGRMQQAGQAHAAGRKARSAMPRVACRCRMAQSPFGRTAGRCRGKAGRRWQHLRVMRDFGFLDAKEGPWRQDSRAMYPESPDCARKWMHGARMLPFRSRRACISSGCCQEGGLFRAFGEKGMHTARFLPARALGPPQREERDGGVTRMSAHGGRDAGGGAR